MAHQAFPLRVTDCKPSLAAAQSCHHPEGWRTSAVCQGHVPGADVSSGQSHTCAYTRGPRLRSCCAIHTRLALLGDVISESLGARFQALFPLQKHLPDLWDKVTFKLTS